MRNTTRYVLLGADKSTEQWLSSTYILCSILSSHGMVPYDDHIHHAYMASRSIKQRIALNRDFTAGGITNLSTLLDTVSAVHGILPDLHRLNISLIEQLTRHACRMASGQSAMINVMGRVLLDSYRKYVLKHTYSCMMSDHEYSRTFGNEHHRTSLLGIMLANNGASSLIEESSPHDDITVDAIIDVLSFDSFLLMMGYDELSDDTTSGNHPFDKHGEFTTPRHMPMISVLMTDDNVITTIINAIGNGITCHSAFERIDGYASGILSVNRYDDHSFRLPPLSMDSLETLSRKPLNGFPDIVVNALLNGYGSPWIDDIEWMLHVDFRHEPDYYLAYDAIMLLLRRDEFIDSVHGDKFIDYPSLMPLIMNTTMDNVGTLINASIRTHDDDLLRVTVLISDIINVIRRRTGNCIISLTRSQYREMLSLMSNGMPFEFVMETALAWSMDNQHKHQISNSSEFVLISTIDE